MHALLRATSRTRRLALVATCAAGLVLTAPDLAHAAPQSAQGTVLSAAPLAKKHDRHAKKKDRDRRTRPSRDGRPDGPPPWLSEESRDRVGFRRSAYTGRYFDPAFEQFRLCVVQRESGGRYGIVSSGAFRGAYQFSSAWKYEIVKRLDSEMSSTYGDDVWKDVKRELLKQDIDDWNRFWQDAGFWSIFNRGLGARNWYGGNWSCDSDRWDEYGWPSRDHWNWLKFEGPRDW